MTGASDNARVDPADLGDLLVVLHGAEAPRGRVEVTYRVWRHQERLHAAFTANAEPVPCFDPAFDWFIQIKIGVAM